MTKKLYRSDENVVVGGVLGGVAEYYEIDPVLIRILAVFIAIITGIVPFALVYLLSVVVIPKRYPFGHVPEDTSTQNDQTRN